MEIKCNDTFLTLKINTPKNINFFEEHKKIIDSNGYVWLCKFGKTQLLTSKINSNKYIFLKDTRQNNDNTYLVEFENATYDTPENNFPNYYNEIDVVHKSLWFKITNIIPIDYKFLIDNFVSTSTQANLENVFKSMCNSFYITAINNLKIKEE